MKRELKLWSAILIVAALTGCSGQWAPNSGGGGGGGQGRNRPHATEDEVRQQFDKLIASFSNGDMESINGMMSSGAVFILPTLSSVVSWPDARPKVEQAFGNRGPHRITADSNYRIGVNRDMGWIATVYHDQTQGTRAVFKSDGEISVLFQKTEGGYKVLLFHASSGTSR